MSGDLALHGCQALGQQQVQQEGASGACRRLAAAAFAGAASGGRPQAGDNRNSKRKAGSQVEAALAGNGQHDQSAGVRQKQQEMDNKQQAAKVAPSAALYSTAL